MSINKKSSRKKKITASNGKNNQPANIVASINTPSKTKSEQQYEIYRSVDPFPDIEPALLNYADAYKYIKICGIIDEFDKEKLKGITYTCSFSGNAYFCEPNKREMKLLEPDKEGYCIINSNSITYLEIAETIRVPEYLALRFNLTVSNAFKGLLLGTGPVVDPGFVGKLYIPLHNLTANTYKIKKGAGLILIEFTKQSRNDKWKNTIAPVDVPSPTIKIKEIEPLRTFKKNYITKALTGDIKFRNVEDANYVGSSIPNAITNAADQAQESAKNVKVLRNWGIAGILTVVFSLVGIFWGGYQLISDTNSRYDTMSQQINDYQSTNNQYQKKIDDLQRRLIILEIDDKQGQLDLLTDEYASIVDINSDSGKKLNGKIIQLEKEIVGLQSQLH